MATVLNFQTRITKHKNDNQRRNEGRKGGREECNHSNHSNRDEVLRKKTLETISRPEENKSECSRSGRDVVLLIIRKATDF